jgi:hypothetical protein
MQEEKLKLFAGLLGRASDGELVEEHRVEFIVASNEDDAKQKLKNKWKTSQVHVDGVKELKEVDGYEIIIKSKECNL